MAISFTGLQSLDPSNFLGDRPDVGDIIRGRDQARFAGAVAGLRNAAEMELALKEIALNKKKRNLSKRFGAQIQGANDQAETMGGLTDLLQIGASFAGSGAFGGSGTKTIGLGDGFNVGVGQAGLDTAVDLDRYLTSSPISSVIG